MATISTQVATDIHSTYATMNGSFILEGTERVVYYEFLRKEGINGDVVEICKSAPDGNYPSGSYSCSPVVTYKPDTTYYFKFAAYLYNFGMIYGDWLSFTTGMVVIVITQPATNIHSTYATLNGSFTKDDEIIDYKNFCYKKGIDGDVVCWGITIGNYPAGSYEVNLFPNTLDPDTIYCFRFLVHVKDYGEIYGDWSEFVTSPLSIAITKEATEMKNLKTTLNGEIVVGEDGCKESSFEWKEGLYGAINVEIVLSYGGSNYSKVITGLVHETLYYFRARGKSNSNIYFYGEWLSFITTSVIPIVSTQIATDIEPLSAIGNGTIIDIGGEEPYCIKRGFEVKYSFSGTLEEYNAWKEHGFTGDLILNSETGLLEGTLIKLYEESGEFSIGVFVLVLDDLICGKEYLYKARAKNTAGWGYGSYLAFTTNDLLLRKSCTCGIFTIMFCAYVKSIPSGSVIKRRGFRWGIYDSAQEYDIHEDGNFSVSATIGPVDTISFVCSNDDTVYDTIVDSSGGFLTAGFEAGKFINVSATGAIDPTNKGKFKIISVTADTITVNVRNTLVSEVVTGVTIVDLFALYIVDLDPETDYYSVAYVAIEDSEGNWTVQEGNVTLTTTIVNIFDFEGYDKVEFYKPEREQNYKKITRKIVAEITAEQQYIDLVGGRRFLPIKNHLIQTKENAVVIGTNYKDRFKNIKSLMSIEYPTPPPLQNEDTLDIGFGRIRFKLDDKGIVNFMPDGEGLMLFRYRMLMMIRKINMSQTISKENIDYMATMELEEA